MGRSLSKSKELNPKDGFLLGVPVSFPFLFPFPVSFPLSFPVSLKKQLPASFAWAFFCGLPSDPPRKVTDFKMGGLPFFLRVFVLHPGNTPTGY